MTVTPIELFASCIHLHPGGRIHARTAPPDAGRDGWRLRAYHARTDADVHGGRWEVHPEAEEVVSCIAGKVRVRLRPQAPGQAEEEVRLWAGTAAIVPRGRWHRVHLDIPSTIMTVTLPHGGHPEETADAGPGR
ncbi:cupin [Nonomuraea candida]|uniref:cupin n=1 Tax=Nonomuraea candida TaxID=359159 RepID=UPI0005BB23E3|nr:cupin [Nonomuraea candida]